ncbi:MAG: NUDIX hydrolase [Anaerolineales bacterium]|nr:NUDIX hydrolase [Anaerolineales bacterium]
MSEALKWLDWAREIQSLAHTSLHYAQNPFEASRAQRLLEIASEIVAVNSEMEAQDVLVAFTAQPGYITPKVDVRAAVFRDGELLMVREAMDGKWTLPGGWADVGETPSLAVEREVQEETGLTVAAKRLIGVYDANRLPGELPLYHAYKLLFLCEPGEGNLKTSEETSEVAFFPIDELPSSLSAYRTTPRHIKDAISANHDPIIPVVFD